MAGVDTSIYGNLQPPNPMAQLSQFAGTQNQLNQNQAFQQQFLARNAMGEIAQKSVDQSSGKMDWDKFSLGIATDPRTTYMARDVIESLNRQRLLEAQTFGKKLENAQLQTDLMQRVLAPIAMDWAKNGTPSDPKNPGQIDISRVLNAGGELISQNPDMQDSVMNAIVGLKRLSITNGKDAAGQALIDLAKGTEIAKRGIDGVQSWWTQNQGPVTSVGTEDKFSGKRTQTGVYAQGLEPNAAQKLEATTNPNTGQPQIQPRASLPMAAQGQPPTQGILGGPGPSGGEPTPTPVTGRPSTSPATSDVSEATGTPGTSPALAMPQASSGPAAPQPTAGGSAVLSGQIPAVAEAQKQVIEKYAPALQDRATQANQLMFLMNKAQEETKNFRQGGGTSQLGELAKLAQSIGVKDEIVDKIASGSLPSTQATAKLYMQIGSQIAAQLIHAGGGRLTQTEWAQTLEKGAANLDMDPRAVAKIFAAMRELAHFTSMENRSYQQHYQSFKAGNYDISQFPSEWQSSLATHLDARAKQQGAI